MSDTVTFTIASALKNKADIQQYLKEELRKQRPDYGQSQHTISVTELNPQEKKMTFQELYPDSAGSVNDQKLLAAFLAKYKFYKKEI